MLWMDISKFYLTKWTKCHHYSYGTIFWIYWIILLVVLQMAYGFKTDINNNYYNRSKGFNRGKQMQRRFLWKEMNKNVEQFFGNAMKNMLKGYMRKKQPSPLHYTIPDNVPTETIKVTYIIKNPHTKEMKIIKMRPKKKIITMMEAISQQPTLLDNMNMNNNNQQTTSWVIRTPILNELDKDKDNVIMKEMALLSLAKSRQQLHDQQQQQHQQKQNLQQQDHDHQQQKLQQQLQHHHHQQQQQQLQMQRQQQQHHHHEQQQQQQQQQQQITMDNIIQNDVDNSWVQILGAMDNQKKFLLRKPKKNLTTLHTQFVGDEQLPKSQFFGDIGRTNLSSIPMYEVTECNVEDDTLDQPYNVQHEQNYHSTTLEVDRTPAAPIRTTIEDAYNDHLKNERLSYDNIITMDNSNNNALKISENRLISILKRNPMTTATTIVAEETTTKSIAKSSEFEENKTNLLKNPPEETLNIHQQQQQPIKFYNTLVEPRIKNQIHSFHNVIRHTRTRGSVKYGDKILNPKEMESNVRTNKQVK